MNALNRIGLAVIVLMFTGLACKSSTAPSTPVARTTSKTFTSTTVQDHSHTITILIEEFDKPLPGGLSRQTSASSGHSHTLTMTVGQLREAAGMAGIQIETTADSGHSHAFYIHRWS